MGNDIKDVPNVYFFVELIGKILIMTVIINA